MGESQRSGADGAPMRDTNEVQLSVRVSLIVAVPDADAERVDAVAGCEFLDDRLRREE
jgi:hypothetical protein